MKKTLSILLIATLAISSVVGTAAVVSKRTAKDSLIETQETSIVMSTETTAKSTDATTPTVKPTQAPTVKPTQAPTQAPTVKPTQAPTKKPATKPTQPTNSPSTSNSTCDEMPVMPNLIGVWGNLDNGGYCVRITNQNGNRIDFTIESRNLSNTKIATADISVTLDTCYEENGIGGTAGFRYCDSFGNSGTGSIIISGNLIDLTICEEYNSCSGWGIGIGTGTYIRV